MVAALLFIFSLPRFLDLSLPAAGTYDTAPNPPRLRITSITTVLYKHFSLDIGLQ